MIFVQVEKGDGTAEKIFRNKILLLQKKAEYHDTVNDRLRKSRNPS